MKNNKLNLRIAGEAGDGLNSSSLLFAKTFSRNGYNVYVNGEFRSQIRGGQNYYNVRIGEGTVNTHSNEIDILLALNEKSVEIHKSNLTEDGYIIYDSEQFELNTDDLPDNIQVFPIPLRSIAKEAGSEIMKNTVAVGAILGLLKYDLELFKKLLAEIFKKKGEEVINQNWQAAEKGFNLSQEKFQGQVKIEITPLQEPRKNMLLNGNDAICLGAIKAGCKFVSEYPMTPSSSILHFMAARAEDYNVVVKHTEDEIAAMLMLIGASFAGARVLTGTSGGGFSLMAEGLGLAGMSETPIVVVNSQRPGPSTGLPTRTEQGDLQFMLHASQGEFPRIVIAPGDLNECFYETFRAFNLAEKYQLPVIILVDKYLSESIATNPPYDTSDLKIDRGKLLSEEELNSLKDPKRYELTEDGISPRWIPGIPNHMYRATGDTHNEKGGLAENSKLRTAMMDKRAKKLQIALQDLPKPKLIGPEDADITLVSWGSNKNTILEVLEKLEQKNIKANFLQILYMLPFHTQEVKEILSNAKRVIDIEVNGTGQLAALIREKTGFNIKKKILKYSGRPFSSKEILLKLKKLI